MVVKLGLSSLERSRGYVCSRIKYLARYLGYDAGHWIDLAQDRDQ